MRLCQCVPPSYAPTCGIDGLQNDDTNRNSATAPSRLFDQRKQSHSYSSDRHRLLDGWPCPLTDSCDDDWTWNINDRSHEVKLYGPRSRTVLFHPGWSNGTAGVRGTKPLLAPFQDGYAAYYWEIDVSHRVFGTSLMFGVGTRRAELHAYSFISLLGKDVHSWGLNHRGFAWHGDSSSAFTLPFLENTPTTISLLLDWTRDNGVLEYYKDGKSLGVAFRNLAGVLLNNAQSEEDMYLYPMVSSTAARTEMCLVRARTKWIPLADRCKWKVAKCLRSRPADVDRLELPDELKAVIRKRVLHTFWP